MRPFSLVLTLLSIILPRVAQSSDLAPVAPPVSGPVRGISSPFSVAFGADGGVAVWKVGFGAIWGVPLDRDGRQTAPARWILAEKDGLDQPEVRFVGGEFVLWWIRSWPRATRVAGLDPELRPLEPRSIGVGTTAPLAWNGSVALAATGRYPVSNDVAVHFLDRSFARLASDSFADLGGVGYPSAVALADGTFAVVVPDESGRLLIRYSAGGERLGTPQRIDTQRGTAAIATDGESILIANVAASSPGVSPHLRTVMIHRDGTIEEHDAGLPAAWTSVGIDLEWAGGVYTIAASAGTEGQSTEESDLYASRISPDGELLEEFTPLFVRPGTARRFDLVRAGAGLALVFEEGGYGTGVLFSIALPATGALTRTDVTRPDARVSDTAAIQTGYSAASDGVGWMLVWRESIATGEEMRGVLLDPDGNAVGTPLTHASGGIFQLNGINVTFNGIDYVVAWVNWGALHVRRFSRDGAPVDPQPVVVAYNVSDRPSLASNNGATLIAWDAGGVIRGVVLSADGRATPPLLLSPAAHDDGADSISYHTDVVAASDDGFLVAFAERRSFPCYFPGSCRSEERPRAQVISRSGEHRGPLLTLDARGVNSAAGAEGSFLVAIDSGGAVLVDAATATVLKTFPLTRGAASVFATGAEFTVVSKEHDRLAVRRVRSEGTVVRAEETEFVGQAVAASPAGALLAVAVRAILEPPYFGNAALLAGVADTFLPTTSDRRRLAGR